jgi:hypothetical protein
MSYTANNFPSQVRDVLARRGFSIDGCADCGTLRVEAAVNGAVVKVANTYASLAGLRETGQRVFEALGAEGFDVITPDVFGETTVYAPDAVFS